MGIGQVVFTPKRNRILPQYESRNNVAENRLPFLLKRSEKQKMTNQTDSFTFHLFDKYLMASLGASSRRRHWGIGS